MVVHVSNAHYVFLSLDQQTVISRLTFLDHLESLAEKLVDNTALDCLCSVAEVTEVKEIEVREVNGVSDEYTTDSDEDDDIIN